MNRDKWTIRRINFYHRHELLVQVGESEKRLVRTQNDFAWVEWDGRVEVFHILAHEQLIGCELHLDNDSFVGVTWLKIKSPTNVRVLDDREKKMKKLNIGSEEGIARDLGLRECCRLF